MYTYSVEIEASTAEAERRIRRELEREGFGVLTEIDVEEVLKEKLGVDWSPYRILGTCNPEFSHRALETEKELGVLLPCNVVVYEDDGATKASAVSARRMLSLVDNPDLGPIAEEVDERLGRALDRAAKS
ncbi:MAG: hypothetical protein MAG715_01161 [Methanonatronarchaeales archaeon]|nr:hypothetical protein [Methanonatronarchaeales archaeon]